MRLYLVGCSKSKRPTPAGPIPAFLLYRSPLFELSREYAQRRVLIEGPVDCWWAILSFQHGVIRPTTPLLAYDSSPDRASAAHRRRWASRCWEQAEQEVRHQAGEILELVVLAGRRYADPLAELSASTPGRAVTQPLRGLQIGERMRWLARELGRMPDPLRGLTRV